MKLKLPVPPSVNKMYRNVQGVGRVKTSVYKSWIEAAGWGIVHKDLSIPGPVVVSMAIPTNNRRDLDNHAKPILDLLVLHKVIDSDRCKTVRGISMHWHDDSQVEVTVEPAAI